MKKCIVFFGKPGVGKSTIIDLSLPSVNRIDVMPFVKNYEQDGKVSEEKTVLGYQDMYNHVSSQLSSNPNDMVLELGTNHEKLNCEELKKISSQYNIIIFLCIAPVEICRKRGLARGRPFDLNALELRLRRNFPEIHIAELSRLSLEYLTLDMELPLEHNKEIILTKLN